MNITTSDGISLYVSRRGNGIPMIYIHGGPGAWSYPFEYIIGQEFISDISMVYLDQRGCGRSTGDDNSDYSMERLVSDIEEVRIEFGFDSISIVAHSFGGIIATCYATEYPGKVDKLILMNVTLDIKESLKSQTKYGNQLMNKVCNKNTDYLDEWTSTINDLIDEEKFYKLHYRSKANSAYENGLNVDLNNRSMAMQALANDSYFIDYTIITPKVKCQVLIIAGSDDYAVGIEHHKRFNFTNSKVKIISGKHALYLENRKEIVTGILQFVRN